MMKRRAAELLLLVICVLPLGGCWDQLPLSELTTPFGMGVDLNEAHQRVFTFSQPNFSPYASNNDKQVTYIAANLDEAIQEYENTSRGTVVLGQLHVVFLSEAVAKESIADLAHDLAQTTEVGLNTYLIVTQGSARTMLSLRPVEYTRIANFTFLQLQNQESENRVVAPTLWRVRYALATPGIDPSVPYFVTDMNTGTPRLAGQALFCHDQMVSTLSNDQLVAYQILTGQVAGLPVDVELPARGAAFHVKLSRSKVDYQSSIAGDGQWRCRVMVEVLADLEGVDNLPEIGAKITKDQANQQIKSLLTTYLQESLHGTVQKLVELQADPLGISRYIRAQHPRDFDEQKWRQQYGRMKIDVEVKTTVRRMGTIG